MSLYNMLFGVNSNAGLVLTALGITEADVPRFRDAYYDAEEDRLVIHTRTGGGNRDYYDSEERCRAEYPEYFSGDDEAPSGPWNSDLRALPGFKYDRDDDFDCTYADFIFAVPEAFKPIFDTLKDLGAGTDPKPAERWQTTLAAMQSGEKTPDAERALEVGKQIIGPILQALETPPPADGVG